MQHITHSFGIVFELALVIAFAIDPCRCARVLRDGQLQNGRTRSSSLLRGESLAAAVENQQSCKLLFKDSLTGPVDICIHNPRLGDGKCPRKVRQVVLSEAKQRPDEEIAAVIRRSFRSPFNFDSAWDALFTRIAPQFPGKGWKILHDRGVYALDDFLSAEEADHIVERSLVATPSAESHVNFTRTRECCFRHSTSFKAGRHDMLPPSLIPKMVDALHANADNFESTQVVRYQPGDFYSDHFDVPPCDHFKSGRQLKGVERFMLAGSFDSAACDAWYRRSGTLLVYLTDNHGGGATFFPKLGVRVAPKKGAAIFFRPTFADGVADPYMLHAAEMVSKGTKVVLQQWIVRGPPPEAL